MSVLPAANAQGINPASPVVAVFSEEMNEGTITTGSSGTFNVFGSDGELVPGDITFDILNGRSTAIWQVDDGILNRFRPNEEYTIAIKPSIRDLDNNELFNEWVSTFRTTGTGSADHDPPQLTLSVEPPTDPNYVLPGEIVTVNAYAVDQGSGVVRVELRMKDLDGTNTLFTPGGSEICL